MDDTLALGLFITIAMIGILCALLTRIPGA
jgi:hypothetical protein